jgi:NAD(P)-dependent dehydrogenase (short-subunit alcohol dehydrogenase family)
MVAVMQKGVLLALKYGSQAMAVTSKDKPKSKGSIVATSSMAAFLPSCSNLTYSAVKTAVVSMVQSGALQLSSSNIRVNGFAPGATKTSIFSTSKLAESGKEYQISIGKDANQIEQVRKTFAARTGLEGTDAFYYYNRVAPAEELARVGVFLATDASAVINGQVILADSGKTIGALGESFTGRILPVPVLKYD